MGGGGGGGVLVSGDLRKEVRFETLAPRAVDRFPWSGHLGLNMLAEVLAFLDSAPGTTLLFTNTRSQTELWFRAISGARPQWLGQLAVHHGSLDGALRREVETLIASGGLRCVCCTSSLDLGVDFSPVDQVIQVGSPKGVARLLQRAGRSGHRPGVVSAVRCVPTQALELVEFAAAREAAAQRVIEPRQPIDRPLDVLVQHLVTCALGGGFVAEEMLREVRGAWSFRTLTEAEWRWCLDFVERGGPSLVAYPQYARVRGEGGRYDGASAAVARLHRLSIGTISSDATVTVRYLSGGTIGTIEESFIGRLSPGDRFFFAGRRLELVRVREMTAFVRASTRATGHVPKWGGGRTPLSSELASAVRTKLGEARRGEYASPEMALVRPLLELQQDWSCVPREDEFLIESARTRDGHHVFLFPVEGRLVHEGLGALLAFRLTRDRARTISVTVNDYGIELLSPEPLALSEAGWRAALSARGLLDDLMACLNSTELTRRQFRDIARVAGLLFPGYPGGRNGRGGGGGRTARHLQASSDLFYDVFAQFDPENRLLEQARREVLQQQLESGRLAATLDGLAVRSMVITEPGRLTPLAFPLWAERLRTQHVTSERWADRVKKMALRLESEAEGSVSRGARRRGPKGRGARGGAAHHAG
ncbi:MAG TPA: DNA ligase-associated DEXH box helicase [Phycisphaerales bacterium]|nr:DNA ligase-associated DEXH box helicase [Phycisphaerales bacterium]